MKRLLSLYCFNPYFVGDESGRPSVVQLLVLVKLVSILILLEMSLEDIRYLCD